jgi:phospho-N-acetylmuramoyl-pentapeptide-transferase
VRTVLIAAAVALVCSLFVTPLFIRFLVRRSYGQLIRDDGPTSHHTKRGTPTMGGAVIIASALLGYVLAHAITLHPPTPSGMLVLFLMTAVFFLSTYVKVAKQRSLGLGPWAKLAGQMIVALTFAVVALKFPDPNGFTPASTEISFIRDTGVALGSIGFVLWAYVMIAGTSNGVNLTDGLDGLATGTSVMVFASYVLIGIWQFGNACPGAAGKCYEARDPLDLAVVAAAVMGACFGFLWWNASPARSSWGTPGRWPWRGAGRAGDPQPDRAAAGAGRRVFVLIALGHRAGRLLQAHRQTGVPDGAAAAPLRAGRLGRGDDRHPVLDHRRPARRAGLGVFYAEWVTGAGREPRRDPRLRGGPRCDLPVSAARRWPPAAPGRGRGRRDGDRERHWQRSLGLGIEVARCRPAPEDVELVVTRRLATGPAAAPWPPPASAGLG